MWIFQLTTTVISAIDCFASSHSSLLAVLLADGGEAIADLAVLQQQPDLFGAVASDAIAWRVLDAIDEPALARLRAARATARELTWAHLAETRRVLPGFGQLGRSLPGFALDIDATIVLSHSQKESTAPTWKHTFRLFKQTRELGVGIR